MVPAIQLDPEAVRNGLYAAMGAGGGYAVKAAVDWWIRRSERRETADDRRHEREQAIADANDELATKLREELREELTRRDAENQQLRDRLSQVEGRADELSRVNAELRTENMALQKQSGEDKVRLDRQASVIADQGLKISTLQNDLGVAKDRIGVLEEILRQSNIDVPASRKPGTGPLSARPAGV